MQLRFSHSLLRSENVSHTSGILVASFTTQQWNLMGRLLNVSCLDEGACHKQNPDADVSLNVPEHRQGEESVEVALRNGYIAVPSSQNMGM